MTGRQEGRKTADSQAQMDTQLYRNADRQTDSQTHMDITVQQADKQKDRYIPTM